MDRSKTVVTSLAVAVLGAAAQLCVAPVHGLSAAASTVPAPSQLLAEALSAGRAQSSVRWSTSYSIGAMSATLVTESGRTSGLQRITVSEGSSTGHVTAELVNGTAYLDGDRLGLENFVGFGATAGATQAGRWLSVGRASPEFATISAGLTVRSTLSELSVAGSLSSVAPTVVFGEHVIGVRGSSGGSDASTSAVLYVRASGAPLPVEQDETFAGSTTRARFEDWGASLRVLAPSGAVPFQMSWLQGS